jgi:glycyl-tRNA synthetase beta chain
LLERRGFRSEEARAVAIAPTWWSRPASVLLRVQALAHARKAPEFETLAVLFKRVKNITKNFDEALTDDVQSILKEPAEIALLNEMRARWPTIEAAAAAERYGDAMRELGAFGKPVDRFFVDVLVMADDPVLRNARLKLLSALRRTILNIADISEIAPDETKEH